MVESAVDRTPVEIWSYILHLAARWYPLPTESDPVNKHISFFDHGCARFHEYQDIEVIRGKIRLVCRSWNALVQDIPHDLVLVTTDGDVWPSVNAIPNAIFIEYVVADDALCECRSRASGGEKLRVWDLPVPLVYEASVIEKRTISESQMTTLIGSTPKAASLLANLSNSSAEELLNNPSTWRALSFNIASSTDSLLSWLHRHSPPSLTHLFIDRFSPNDSTTYDIFLPQLLHLRLRYEELYGQSNNPQPLFTWKTPKLQIFHATGYVSTSLENDVKAFLLLHSQTITVLLLNLYSEQGFNSPTVEEFWDHFPNLTAFAATCRHYFRYTHGRRPTSPPTLVRAKPLAVYLHDIRESLRIHFLVSSTSGEDFRDWCLTFSSGLKIIMPMVWYRAKTVTARKSTGVRYPHLPKGAKAFFGPAMQAGIEISFQSSSLVTEEDERALLETFRTGEIHLPGNVQEEGRILGYWH